MQAAQLQQAAEEARKASWWKDSVGQTGGKQMKSLISTLCWEQTVKREQTPI